MFKTLGELIASGDFTGYKTTNADDAFSAEAVEDLLYGRNHSGYSLGEAHSEAFQNAHTLTAVEINTWCCTDTNVGLEVLCLDGTPVALSWQTARRNPRDLALLNKEARDLLIKAWEAHRPDPEITTSYVDQIGLDTPVAPPGAEAFEIDEQSSVYALRPSLRGVAQWLWEFRDATGKIDISSATNLGQLEALKRGTLADLKRHDDLIAQIDQQRAGGDPRDDMNDYYTECKEHVAGVRSEILGPIDAQIEKLSAQAG